MYAKFAAAIACLILCSLNVVAAVKRTPIRTTLEGSTRTTVEMMPSPNSSVHWLSATIFMAGFAGFLSWGISEYNSSLEEEETTNDSVNRSNNITPSTTQYSPPINPAISGKNIIQFTPRVSSNSAINPEKQSQILSPEEFYSQLQQEDYWDDNEDTNNNPSAS
ncbi:MAG: hypothetical protein HC903_06355 [Methylacidiphilales bacterium]|nr:hypothetical protein [Candidatus Methylacidiphilales bacterium]NJR19949.1 hypothetical protein [Calothrix sp. CSU_2_0]